MLALQRELGRFEAVNTQVLGVSADDPETHRRFAEENGISFPLISDDGGIKRLFGGGRVTYLVDRDGRIRHIQKGVPEIKEFLKRAADL